MDMPRATKPTLGLASLININFGFFGIQIGLALQNANMSRVFQSLGSSIDDLAVLWVAAPLTGLLVQPLIGHVSDRTWLGWLGRRRPFFLAGAVLSALALVLMPISNGLLMAALLLWMLDANLNVSMEPYRAFVGDMLPKGQHTLGYGVQTAFIGAGAVVGSLFPWALDQLGVSNVAAAGALPDTVSWSLRAGGVILLLAVGWTVISNREYSPAEMALFGDEQDHAPPPSLAGRSLGACVPWLVAGGALALAVMHWGLRKEMLLLAGLIAGYGVAVGAAILQARRGRTGALLASIVGDFAGMPRVMKQLAVVQFFSWSALFIMWVHTTPVVATRVFGASDPASAPYQAAGNWVGVLFAVYNAVAAVASLALLPWLSRRIGGLRTHALCLLAGAVGFGLFMVIRDSHALILAELGIGLAWASILAIPYAILASALPPAKLGVYMGLFNIFIVIPQLLVATVMGSLMQAFFPHDPVWTMGFAAASMGLAALLSLRMGRRMG